METDNLTKSWNSNFEGRHFLLLYNCNFTSFEFGMIIDDRINRYLLNSERNGHFIGALSWQALIDFLVHKMTGMEPT